MGASHPKVQTLWLKMRPETCDPYYIQETKVLKKFNRVLRVLDMTHEHGKMFYALFSKIDVDFSGDVDIWEFADFYQLTLSLFIQRLFKQLDMHDKGGLFFGEYLFSIWNLGTLNFKEIIVFVYNLYDEAHTGLMSHDTMRNVILEMYELDMRVDERIPNFLLKMVDVMFAMKRAKSQAPFATIENFARFADKYPEFIHHALALQSEVVSRSLNANFWDRAKYLRSTMAISHDPASFLQYIKDLTEMGNEKNVTRKGGDADSDLGGSEDEEEGGSGGSGEDDDKEKPVVKSPNRRKLRQRALRFDPRTGALLPTVPPVAVEGTPRKSPRSTGSRTSRKSNGGSKSGDLESVHSEADAAAGAQAATHRSDGEADAQVDVELAPATTPTTRPIPAGVSPLFSPETVLSPAGLAKLTTVPSPVKHKAGRRKLASIAPDPKWDRGPSAGVPTV